MSEPSNPDGQAAFTAAVLAAGGQVNGEPTRWHDDPTPRAPFTPDPLTDEQQAARKARIAEWHERQAAEREAVAVFADALTSITDPVARAVLDLHKVDGSICAEEQDDDGYGTSWPCQTVVTVATTLGIPVPPHLVD